jgi:hypothetical protein
MKRAVSLVGLWVALAAIACGPSPAYEPEAPESPPPPSTPATPTTPPPPPGAAPAGSTPADPAQMQSSDGTTDPPPSSAAELPADAAPPPPDQWTVRYPTGQWVYANGYGWVWVPNDANQVVVEETPYVYVYTPAYGWTWYVSPWGPGPYRYGVWVVHPWHPIGWRYGWVARPGVVVRLHGHPHYVRGPYRGARPAPRRRR